MATKKDSKKTVKKAGKQNSDDRTTNEVEKSSDHQGENPFDFGGIPARDLKKNLGCG